MTPTDSPADRLRELREAADAEETRGIEDHNWWDLAVALVNAAPQIEALIRAAEDTAFGNHPGDRDALRVAVQEVAKVL